MLLFQILKDYYAETRKIIVEVAVLVCARLNLTGCQKPTQLFSHFPPSPPQQRIGGEIKGLLWVKIKTEITQQLPLWSKQIHLWKTDFRYCQSRFRY